MKVKELINRLSKEDPNIEVMVSIDEEGNGFESLAEVGTYKYFDGEVYGDDDTEAPEECTPVIVLWP